MYNLGLCWRCSNTLCVWSRKLAHRLKTNLALATRFLPHLTPKLCTFRALCRCPGAFPRFAKARESAGDQIVSSIRLVEVVERVFWTDCRSWALSIQQKSPVQNIGTSAVRMERVQPHSRGHTRNGHFPFNKNHRFKFLTK